MRKKMYRSVAIVCVLTVLLSGCANHQIEEENSINPSESVDTTTSSDSKQTSESAKEEETTTKDSVESTTENETKTETCETSEEADGTVYFKSIGANVSGTYQIGDTLPAEAFTVVVSMSDGTYLTNPEGWAASPLVLTGEMNLIEVTYKNLSTVVAVVANATTNATPTPVPAVVNPQPIVEVPTNPPTTPTATPRPTATPTPYRNPWDQRPYEDCDEWVIRNMKRIDFEKGKQALAELNAERIQNGLLPLEDDSDGVLSDIFFFFDGYPNEGYPSKYFPQSARPGEIYEGGYGILSPCRWYDVGMLFTAGDYDPVKRDQYADEFRKIAMKDTYTKGYCVYVDSVGEGDPPVYVYLFTTDQDYEDLIFQQMEH